MKVAAVPAIIAKPNRIQNSLFSFLSLSLFSASLKGGSDFEPSGYRSQTFFISFVGSDFSVSGISVGSSFLDSFFESSGPGVGFDFFFLNFAN